MPISIRIDRTRRPGSDCLPTGPTRSHELPWLSSVDRAEVRACYRAADLCVVPLKPVPELQACIPSKLFEIMACGRPVVAALRGPAAAIVESAGAGRVVPPGDASAVADAVAALSEDPATAAAAGRAGLRWVTTHNDRRRLAERYVELLGRAMAAQR